MSCRLLILILLASCDTKTTTACDGASLLASPADLAAPGPWRVGVRTVVFDQANVEIWYPATPGPREPVARYDLRTFLPDGAAKIPDDANPLLACACVRDVPLDTTHGPYPVIFFFHGAASFRAQSVFLTAHWASRGFIVIAPDLPGVGLREVLTNENTGYPATFPNRLLDAVLAPPASDPFAFVRGHTSSRIGTVGHSLGSMLASTLDARPEVTARISLAGFLAFANKQGSVLGVMGATDGIAPPNHAPALAEAHGRARAAIIPGAGHLAFTDLCTLGADRGGPLAIAKQYGIAVPDMIATLATDGCRPTDAPFARTAPAIRAITTGVLEETLRCDASKAAAIRALSSTLELHEKPAR